MHHLPPSPERFHWTSGIATINIPGAPAGKERKVVLAYGQVVQVFWPLLRIYLFRVKTETTVEGVEEAVELKVLRLIRSRFAFPHGNSKPFQRRKNAHLHEEILIAVNVDAE